MNFFLRLFCWIMVLVISGCQGLHQDVFRKQAIERCNITCMQHFAFCKQHCINNCKNCSIASTQSATKYFAKYVHEREVEGKKVMRELNSYRDPLQCRKITCDCLSDLEICKMGCTGVIKKRLQKIPYCI